MTINKLPLLGSLLLSGLITAGACSSSNSSGTGGTTGSLGGGVGSLGGAIGSEGGQGGSAGGAIGEAGGTTGAAGDTGAAGAAGGQTGAAGGASGCSTLPPCLAFFGTCAPSGTCVTQKNDPGPGSQTCYSNGVKEAETANYSPTDMVFTETITYTKAGAPCASFEIAASAAGGASGSATETIKDGTGTAVATLTANADGTATVTCAAGGTYVLSGNNCVPMGSNDSTTTDCTAGVCQ